MAFLNNAHVAASLPCQRVDGAEFPTLFILPYTVLYRTVDFVRLTIDASDARYLFAEVDTFLQCAYLLRQSFRATKSMSASIC